MLHLKVYSFPRVLQRSPERRMTFNWITRTLFVPEAARLAGAGGYGQVRHDHGPPLVPPMKSKISLQDLSLLISYGFSIHHAMIMDTRQSHGRPESSC